MSIADKLRRRAPKEGGFERYEHRFTGGGAALVWVMKFLKGRHRDHCLCYSCEHFGRCAIAKAVFDNCVTYNIVTPVWECPDFTEKKS